MSVSLFERLKEFLVRLVKDQSFRTELDNGTVEERQQILKSAGYIFSKEEFETAAIHVLESKERGEFTELNEEELAGVLGGFVGVELSFKAPQPVQPMYGVVFPEPPTVSFSAQEGIV
ncbi:Nif11-like leader peptide family RiPP precursor [Microcoleus sp. BROC3]|uniref:Nif11-like leader peptide family RiPP precursor n=1 Tax=Microcoleus sp. BROC3 TaxID=3055323 RepID=UPI002FCFAAB8